MPNDPFPPERVNGWFAEWIATCLWSNAHRIPYVTNHRTFYTLGLHMKRVGRAATFVWEWLARFPVPPSVIQSDLKQHVPRPAWNWTTPELYNTKKAILLVNFCEDRSLIHLYPWPTGHALGWGPLTRTFGQKGHPHIRMGMEDWLLIARNFTETGRADGWRRLRENS